MRLHHAATSFAIIDELSGRELELIDLGWDGMLKCGLAVTLIRHTNVRTNVLVLPKRILCLSLIFRASFSVSCVCFLDVNCLV